MGINLGGAPSAPVSLGASAPVAPVVDTPTPITPAVLGATTPAPVTINEIKTPQGITLDLGKGAVLDLTKRNPGLRSCTLGAGWDVSQAGPSFDLDITAFLLNADGKITSANDVIFFNHRSAPGITLSEDNRTGLGEGDDETIQLDLASIPAQYDKVEFVVNIFDGITRQQTFGMVQNSYVRLLDAGNGGKELCRFRLNDEYATSTAVVFARLKRSGTDWNFEAIGEGKVVGSLNDILQIYS